MMVFLLAGNNCLWIVFIEIQNDVWFQILSAKISLNLNEKKVKSSFIFRSRDVQMDSREGKKYVFESFM